MDDPHRLRALLWVALVLSPCRGDCSAPAHGKSHHCGKSAFRFPSSHDWSDNLSLRGRTGQQSKSCNYELHTRAAGGQSQIIGAAIAFREARARAAFQTFEPVAIVACLTVKAVARQYDPGQHHDNGCQRSKVIDHSHTPPIAGYSKIDIWNLHKSTIARPVGGVVQKIALHNGS